MITCMELINKIKSINPLAQFSVWDSVEDYKQANNNEIPDYVILSGYVVIWSTHNTESYPTQEQLDALND